MSQLASLGQFRRSVIAVALLCLPVLCQQPRYKDLATTDDGSVLYFSTWLRVKGSDGPLSWKIFAADSSGVRLVAQRAEVRPGYVSNYFVLEEPVVSGDGSLVGFTASANCRAGSQIPCLGWQSLNDFYRAELFAASGESRGTYPSKIRLSANGRFALLYDGQYGQTNLLDVASAKQTLLPGWTIGDVWVNERSGARVVAGDGTLAATRRYSEHEYSLAIGVARQSGIEFIPVQDQVVSGSACIDAGATTAFFASYSTQSGRHRIMSLDLASRTVLPLVEAVEDLSQPVSNNDGRLVLFLSQADLTGRNPRKLTQTFITDRGGVVRQLTSEGSGVVEATLAGAGTVAYAISGDDRILRIDVGTGEVREVFKRIPDIKALTKLAFGSLGGAVGEALATELAFTDLPLPTQLGGLKVLLNGTALPLVAVSPTEVLFQIPWDFPQAQSYTLTLDSGPDQVLEGTLQNLALAVKVQNPAFVYLAGESSVPVMAHTTWDGLVTTASPAAVGEIVHFYMTGLGPVSPPVQSGRPGPFGPLSQVTATPRCFFHARGIAFPVPIYWAGLAPGFVGLYQLSVPVPAGMDQHDPGLYCGIGSELDRAVVPVKETAAP